MYFLTFTSIIQTDLINASSKREMAIEIEVEIPIPIQLWEREGKEINFSLSLDFRIKRNIFNVASQNSQFVVFNNY